MKITKKVIGTLEKCYSLAKLFYHGKEHFLVAAEKSERCMLFDLDGTYEETIWEQPGGVMSMVQIPGTDGQFLATQRFYSPNDSEHASIVIAAPDQEGGWKVRTLVKLPFVHRFDLLESDGQCYLIACTIKSGHRHQDDWSSPGRVYVGLLPEDLSAFDEAHQLKLTVLRDGLFQNHGYCRHLNSGGIQSAVISCSQGVFQCTPPNGSNVEWGVQVLLEEPASDALLLDLNGDGEEELITITPFHGDGFNIYQKEKGSFRLSYTNLEKLPFLHAIWGGNLCGRPAVVIGSRNGFRHLLAITCDEEGKFQVQELDRGCGAANVLVIQNGGRDVLIAANREVDEIAMYTLE